MGVVLAAGAGTRFGGPKALARTPDGEPWIARAVTTLTESGCREVVVVLGARADEARPLVPETATVVVAADWAEGLSASLRAALRSLDGTATDRAVVIPVDTPGPPGRRRPTSHRGIRSNRLADPRSGRLRRPPGAPGRSRPHALARARRSRARRPRRRPLPPRPRGDRDRVPRPVGRRRHRPPPLTRPLSRAARRSAARRPRAGGRSASARGARSAASSPTRRHRRAG